MERYTIFVNWKELTLLKCPSHPKSSTTDSTIPIKNSNGKFHRDRTSNPKICIDP